MGNRTSQNCAGARNADELITLTNQLVEIIAAGPRLR